MKIGIMNSAYGADAAHSERYREIAAHGYDCVGIDSFAKPSSPVYTEPEARAIALAEAERRAIEDAGLFIEQVHGPWPTDDTTPALREKKVADIKRAILLTKALGARYLVYHPDMPYGWEREDDPAFAWVSNLATVGALLPAAERAGVILCIENMPMKAHALSTVSRMTEFVETVNHPNLMTCFDTGHAAVFRHDAGECVRRIGAKLACLHCHDNDGTRDQHRLPYEGIVDWKGFSEALREIGYAGAVTLECAVNRDLPEPARTTARIALAQTAAAIAGKTL